MNFDYDYIIKYVSGSKEDYEFIKQLIDQVYRVMLNLISRNLEYKNYNEIHTLTKDSKIYVNEAPIDILSDIHLYYIDKNYNDIKEIDSSNYIIDPENKAYIKISNSKNNIYNYYDIESSFYLKPQKIRIEYFGGYSELPKSLVLLLSMLTKFYYVNRDPGVSQYKGEQLMKIISDYNPEILRLIGAWKCHRI